MDIKNRIINFWRQVKNLFWHLPVIGPAVLKTKEQIDMWPMFYWPRFERMLREKSVFSGPEGKGLRILMINHYFDQDIEAILDANTRHRILVIPHHDIRHLAVKHFRKKMPLDFMKQYNSPDMIPLREAYRKDLGPLVDRLYAFFPFDIAVGTSILLMWVREIMAEIQSRGIPYVMIDKEGTISPYFFPLFSKQIRENQFATCDHIMVWSPNQVRFWELAGARPETIHLVGQQRSDFWFKPHKWGKREETGLGLRPQAPLLVFYSFFKDAYIPKHLYDSGEMRWDSIFDESHKVILDIAAEFPEWDVVIKTHPQQIHDLPPVKRMIEERSLPNLYLATGARYSKFLNVYADVICGFQTTALIEGMMIKDRPIIYLYWGDALKWSEGILPFHKCGAVTVATSPEDLFLKLKQALTNPSSPVTPDQLERRKPFVDEYFWNSDGHVSERTLQILEEIVSETRKKQSGKTS